MKEKRKLGVGRHACIHVCLTACFLFSFSPAACSRLPHCPRTGRYRNHQTLFTLRRSISFTTGILPQVTATGKRPGHKNPNTEVTAPRNLRVNSLSSHPSVFSRAHSRGRLRGARHHEESERSCFNSTRTCSQFFPSVLPLQENTLSPV